jgi:hypothetical protein
MHYFNLIVGLFCSGVLIYGLLKKIKHDFGWWLAVIVLLTATISNLCIFFSRLK